MMREYVIKWISILLFIAISILLIKFFIWILPVLLVLFIGYFIYDYVKSKIPEKEVTIEKGKSKKKNKNKSKKIIIIDEENND